MAAKLSATTLSELRDAEGLDFMQAAAAAGYAASQSADGVLQSAWEGVSNVTRFVELHIEQGAHRDLRLVTLESIATALCHNASGCHR